MRNKKYSLFCTCIKRNEQSENAFNAILHICALDKKWEANFVSLAVTTKVSQVPCSMLSLTCAMPLHKYKREEVRGLLHASQVNSWTVEYLASMKYEAQLAFKRKSSPGASGRSQPARPWSVARQEPCVKAEGLCHCVQMFSPALLAASKHTHTHRKHKPWCKDDLTHRANT